MANATNINALIAVAASSLAPVPPSPALVRAQRLKLVQTNIGSLFNSVIEVDPDEIKDSSYGFELGLMRTKKIDISSGLILIAPGRVLDSGDFDEKSFGDLNDFIFFKVIDRTVRAMDCRFLGFEGSSPLVVMTGISVGEIVTLAIPEFSLACGTMMSNVFAEVLGDRAMAVFEAGPRFSVPATSSSPGTQISGGTHPPRASSTQARKFDDFQQTMRLIEPQSKLAAFFPDSDAICAAHFEVSAVELAIGDAHSSHSTGLGKDLVPLSEADLWTVACLRGGAPAKQFPLTKFRSPASKEPASALAAISCVLLLASVCRAFHGAYVASLMLSCHQSLVWLLTRNPTRFTASHIVDIFDKVLVDIRMCIRDGKEAHLAAVSVNEKTPYVERHLMNDQYRYSETGEVTPPLGGMVSRYAGGGVGGGSAGAGVGAARAGNKRAMPGPSSAAPPTKVPASKAAFTAWVALDPLKGQNLCGSWASNKWGQCAKGVSPNCKRAHQYPASVSATEQQAFVAWSLAKP